MNKTVDESTLKELNNYSNLLDAMMKYLDMYWDIEAKPKGYDEYLKTYEEYDTEDIEYEFDGPLDTSATSSPFPERISRSNVAYNDTQQGRSPLRELIGAVFAYGLSIGAQREKLNDEKLYYARNIIYFLSDIKDGSIDPEKIKTRADFLIEDMKFIFPKLKNEE